jgi:hypothetical protein
VLTCELDAGRNIVLTGVFGSGRTTLVRALEAGMPHYDFLFWGERDTRRTIRAAVNREHCPGNAHGNGRRPTVVVVDDAVHVSRLRVRFVRELLRDCECQIIVVVEHSMPPDEVTRLRAALGAARLVQLGPLDGSATNQYFSMATEALGLQWSVDEIRQTARSTHGHPLTMRTTLEAAVVKNSGRGPG